MEGLLLLMVCLAPWLYGSVHAEFEFLLLGGVSILAVLWSVRMLLRGELVWTKCPVIICLALFFLLGLWQLAPLQRSTLAEVSPATARLYGQLLPEEPEVLPSGEKSVSSSEIGTISVYPHATRLRLLRILAVILVFAVVRHNLAAPGPLRRLAAVALCNGALLSLFALVQFFSSPVTHVYWTYPTMGSVFGPFICRNHFPFYVNLCIGLGLGLLWDRYFSRDDRPAERWAAGRERLPGLTRLLQDPVAIGMCCALALMLCSVVFSMSRGGFLALVGGFVVFAFVTLQRTGNLLRLGSLLLTLALVVGLLGWFGLAEVQDRWMTFWQGTALEEGRMSLWKQALDMAADFPVWGTGFGTYEFANPLYLADTQFADTSVDHVHNDYLEALVEGGVVGLLLTMLTIGLIFRLGYRAVTVSLPARGLALGALFGFTTLVVHSVADFGIHVPAITLLATVLCAHLCALGRPGVSQAPAAREQDPAETNQYVLRWSGLAPLLGAVICVALGAICVGTGWRSIQAHRLEKAAFRVGPAMDTKSLTRKKDYLEAAVRLTPADSNLRSELGEVYADLFREHHERNKADDSVGYAQLVLAATVAPVLTGPSSLALAAAAPRYRAEVEETPLRLKYLVPALRNFIEGRNRGPLLAGPHLGLALHGDKLVRGDAPSTYRNRVPLLAPADPALWYYFGHQELRNGQLDQAWKSWRRSLELSDRYLPRIGEQSVKILGSEGVVRLVLPDQPSQLARVALTLYPRPEWTAEREPFLRRALDILGPRPARLQDQYLKATIHKHLGQFDQAVTLYQTLVQNEPLEATWRLELAQLLHSEGRLEEARHELRIVLAQQPRNLMAYNLFTQTTKELTQKKRAE